MSQANRFFSGILSLMKPTKCSILTGSKNWASSFQAVVSPSSSGFLILQCLWYIDSNEDADHRYMMFSATFNKSCRELARKYLAIDHVRIRVGRAGSTHQNITQRVRR